MMLYQGQLYNVQQIPYALWNYGNGEGWENPESWHIVIK